MERLMENMPNVEAFRGSKVDFLSFFSTSPNIGKASRPTHGCVDEMGPMKVLTYVPA